MRGCRIFRLELTPPAVSFAASRNGRYSRQSMRSILVWEMCEVPIPRSRSCELGLDVRAWRIRRRHQPSHLEETRAIALHKEVKCLWRVILKGSCGGRL